MADDEATEKVDLEIQVDGSKSKSQTSKRKWAVYASIGLIFLLLIIAFLWPLWATAPSSKMYSNNETCVTTECKKAAKLILTSMDSSIDPCTDFYKYVYKFTYIYIIYRIIPKIKQP